MSILSELASRFTAVPADELAQAFSRIDDQRVARRDGGSAKAGARPALPRKLPLLLPLARSPFSTIDPTRIAGVLVAIHDAQLRTYARHGGIYEELWRRLRGFETHLREQASIVDALMSKVAPAQPASAAPMAGTLQQTVLLQCPRGGRSGGRFRCLNRFAEAVEVAVEGGAVYGSASEGGAMAEAGAMAEPACFSLGPGAAMVVRLTLDVGRADTSGVDAVTAAFDVRMNGRPHARVWLEAELYDEES